MANPVVHFEIPADDPESLIAFYQNLFDWAIEKIPGDGFEYWFVKTLPTDEQGMPTEPGAINGGLFRRQVPEQRPITYVNVESVDEYVGTATSLGATVIVGKMAVPGMGWFAQLLDPQGNAFALWQSDASAH